MTERAERRLLDLKARQEAGEHMMCPRCGRDSQEGAGSTNALSRTADVYVCDACGTAEAMLAFMKQDYPLTSGRRFSPSGRPPISKSTRRARSWIRCCAHRATNCGGSTSSAGTIRATPSGTGLRHLKAAPA